MYHSKETILDLNYKLVVGTEKHFYIGEINAQLQRVLDFSAFKNSPILSKFLSFIVSETIHHRQQQIKEYSIAINVLNRRVDFNPKGDAVVRIHAGRLRRALNEYYIIQGMNDPVVINIPKGCYVPQFERGDVDKMEAGKPAATAPLNINAVVAVFPFRTFPQTPEIDHISLMLGEQLSAELSRFQDISVIGYYSMEMTAKIEQNILEAGKLVAADYIVTGSLHYYEQNIHVLVNLLNVATGEVLMTRTFEGEIQFPRAFEILDDIVKNVVGSVGGYYGIIFQEMVKSPSAKAFNSLNMRQSIYAYYKYQRSYSVENYATAFSMLREVVRDHSNDAACWAMLGELYLNGIGLGMAGGEEPVAQGYQCVLQALKIDPLCQQAWHTMALARLFRKEQVACRDAALQCIHLNPNNAVMVSGAGFMLICAGYFDEGFLIMEKAVKINPYYPWWINGGFSFYYLHKKDYSAALCWAEKMKSEETFWDPLLKCVALSYLNKKDEAQHQLAKLRQTESLTYRRIKAIISSFMLSEELLEHILLGVKALGFREEKFNAPLP